MTIILFLMIIKNMIYKILLYFFLSCIFVTIFPISMEFWFINLYLVIVVYINFLLFQYFNNQINYKIYLLVSWVYKIKGLLNRPLVLNEISLVDFINFITLMVQTMYFTSILRNYLISLSILRPFLLEKVKNTLKLSKISISITFIYYFYL